MSVGTTHCLCVMSLREGGREGAARWIWSMDTEALFTPRQYARLISILNPNRDTTIRLVVAEAFGALDTPSIQVSHTADVPSHYYRGRPTLLINERPTSFM